MVRYSEDEFDDLAPTSRKGAHRRSTGPSTQAGAIALVAILAIAALLLVLGTVNIIRSSTGDPEDQVADPQPTTAEPAPEETLVDVVDKTAQVSVLNAAGVAGAGSRFGDQVEDAGWTLAGVANYSTSDTISSIRYSVPEFELQAQALGELLGIGDIEETEEFADDITVVVCSDIASDAEAPATTGATPSP